MNLDERYYTADQPHEWPEAHRPLLWRATTLWPMIAAASLVALLLWAAF